MIVRSLLLVGFVIFGDPALVRCASVSSVSEESSTDGETPNSEEEYTMKYTEFTSTTWTDEGKLADLDETSNTTSNNESKEYPVVTSTRSVNDTNLENFLPDFMHATEEMTTSGLEMLAISSENSTPLEDQVEDSPRPNIFTTLMSLEEEYYKSFNNLMNIYMADSKESNEDKKRKRKERIQAPDFLAELKDDSEEKKILKQEANRKSFGVEHEALKLMPEKPTKAPFKVPTIATSSLDDQHLKTSFLLTSDTELDITPFVSKRLDLQEFSGDNITHRAAYSKKSSESAAYQRPSLTVELDRDSNLLMNANERQELAFEVTNNLNSAARVTFTVRDELGILLEIDRYIAILTAHASTTVKVAVLPKSGQSSDRITFIATASEQIRKEVIVDIESNYRSDTDRPFVDYNYLSDCTDIVLSKCKEGSWTIKISAKDTDSGLKLLTSVPKGIYFPEGYTAGTREEVTGIYSESCCNADLEIIAIDRMNNRYVREINAYRAPLSFWAIIAITLVSLIFLTIIVVSSIICLKKCKKKEADSFDLPTYSGGRSRY